KAQQKQQQDDERTAAKAARAPTAPKPAVTTAPAPAPARKLPYKLQRELEQLPDQIAAAEAKRDDLAAITADADLYSRDQADVQQVLADLAAAEAALAALEERWLELEEMSS